MHMKSEHFEDIQLDAIENNAFTKFLFGFTTAVASGDDQTAIIKNFELTFRRSGDHTETSDPIP